MGTGIIGGKRAIGTVLVVDPDPLVSGMLQMVLDGEVKVISAASWREAVGQIVSGSPDIAIVSMELDEIDSAGLIEIIRERDPTMPVFAVSSRSSAEVEDAARRSGISLFAVKPVNEWMMADAVRKALKWRSGKPCTRRGPHRDAGRSGTRL